MFEVGRICVKIAGRDANKKCLIVDVLENNYVLIDGQTRRKKCNIRHLEPLDKLLKIKKNASHEEVAEALGKEGVKIEEKIKKEKKAKVKEESKETAKDKIESPKKKARGKK